MLDALLLRFVTATERQASALECIAIAMGNPSGVAPHPDACDAEKPASKPASKPAEPSEDAAEPADKEVKKTRGRGRPAGAKNKAKAESDDAPASQFPDAETFKAALVELAKASGMPGAMDALRKFIQQKDYEKADEVLPADRDTFFKQAKAHFDKLAAVEEEPAENEVI